MKDDLTDLQSRIREAKGEEIPVSSEESARENQTGMRVIADVVMTPIVSGGIGIGIDRWFDTKPVFFISLAFLGVCAGFWNLARIATGNDSSVGFKRLQNKEKEGNKAQLSRKETDI